FPSYVAHRRVPPAMRHCLPMGAVSRPEIRGRHRGTAGGPMKISWFHLMPWRWLPDDFRERYHSVWVDLPNRLSDPPRGHQLYNEYLDMLEYADQLGFDAVGVNEHHQNAYGMMPSTNIMAAALARRTEP